MQHVVEQVAAGVTWLLRRDVLRPHQRVPEMDWPGDDDPGSAHFAAYDVSGGADRDPALDEVVGVVTVLRAAPPAAARNDADDRLTWRLRGMATAPSVRGTGVGRDLLARLVEHVARAGGGLLWAEARVPVLGFYERHGFEARGDAYDKPDIGPHVVVVRVVTAGERPVKGG